MPCRTVDDQTLAIVQDTLVIELNKYEVQERCTEVAVPDRSAEGQLRKFIATKRIEGLAPKTLARYADENAKLIRFLGKSLDEITTYDLRFYLSYRRQQGNLSNRTLDGDAAVLQQFLFMAGSGDMLPALIRRQGSCAWGGASILPDFCAARMWTACSPSAIFMSCLQSPSLSA